MITTNTGKGYDNRPLDVAVLQLLLNDAQLAISLEDDTTPLRDAYVLASRRPGISLQLLSPLPVDGRDTPAFTQRIEIYQRARGLGVVDGWVGPNGSTLRSLLADAGLDADSSRADYLRQNLGSRNLQALNVDGAVELYQAQYAPLEQAYEAGLREILLRAKDDAAITSIPQLAYMLATTKHETAHTFLPIEEYGKGAGRPYGEPIRVVDPSTGEVYRNAYYGRGYVQLTWGYNYQRLDHHLGHGSYPNRRKTRPEGFNTGFTVRNPDQSVYLHPEKALLADTAYTALVWGMQNGVFTGKKLPSYVTEESVDYVNARRVINGLDRANDIARYAEDFEIILSVAAVRGG